MDYERELNDSMMSSRSDKILNESYNMQEDLGKIPLWTWNYLIVISDSSYAIENRNYKSV